MEAKAPLTRQTQFDTGLYVYGVERRDVVEVKISFVVPRKESAHFAEDIRQYCQFKDFYSFSVGTQAIKFLGPHRGCIEARGTSDQVDHLLEYVEAHPAFTRSLVVPHAKQTPLNLIRAEKGTA
jgi:hypothetical protein